MTVLLTEAAAAPAAGGFRLSPQQRRSWRLAEARGAATQRVIAAWRVEGDLLPATVEAALHAAVAREEVLRTRFRRVAGMSLPLQVVAEELPPRVEARDLSGLPAAERQTAVAALLDEAAGEPFDVEAGPQLRAVLARLGPDRSLLVLVAPALCLDRPGLAALAAALARGGDPAAAPDEPLQYADLAEWQNGLLEADEGAEEREAWRCLDLAAAARLRLPFEREPPRPAPFAPRAVETALPPELAAACASLAERSEGSMTDVLLAAWRVALGRLLGGAEPVLGAVADGREYPELRGVPGALSKVVPVRLPVDGRWSPERLVREACEALAEARASQEYWDWEVVDAAGGEDAGGPPVLPIGFEARAMPPAIHWGGARLLPAHERSYVEPFSLHLVCRLPAAPDTASPDGRRGTPRLELHYDPERVAEEDARRILEQLVALLGSLTAGGRSAVADADGLGAAERRWLERVGATPPPADERTVVERFAEQAASDPARPALECEGRSLDYGELEELTGRYARRLRALGVGPERIVAVCLDRSVELVAAILAVLRAGGAYLPIDPAQPRQRVAAMLEASGARLALTEERYRALFAGSATEIVGVDDLGGGAGGPGTGGEPLAPPWPAHLAYVLYTSGSTGVPKGVAVEHRQLSAYAGAAVERLELPSGASFATVSTFAADLGHTMVFPALATGGCLHVIATERLSDPEAFADYAERHAIDCLKIVPSHLEALLTATAPARVLPRRRLVVGGETFRWELAERLSELAPECHVFNHYGPTETTVGVLAGAVPAERSGAATVPLGLPLAGARIHLLDPSAAAPRPVPTWAAGEVFIGGAGLARGYLAQPGATAQRFVPDPFAPAERPGARLYRTGDLARRLPDGAVEFLGRVDGQVKIRGFRVEPGEIEALLRGHPGVRDAVVVARSDGGGEQRLVAYLVPRAGARPEQAAAGELRPFLAERLPEAMIPSAFVPLKALPLTANGKVDRRALPAPEAVRPELAATYAPPGTEIERAVAAIWQEVLHLDCVGLHDNFFDLGGHSLLLVQVSARLRERFGCEITMVELFRRTTVASIVAHLAAGEGGEAAGGGARRANAESRRGSLQRQRELRRRRRSAAAQ